MKRVYLLAAALTLQFASPSPARAGTTFDTAWEGDARAGSMSTAVARTVAANPEREVFVRAVASYLYYRTFEEGFELATTSPGVSLEVGYRRLAGATSFTASTGLEVRRDRYEDEEFVSTDWTLGPLFAAEAFTTYEETSYFLAGSYTFAGDYSWVQAGLEHPLLDLGDERSLVLGWDVTARRSGNRSVDLGWILGLDLPARGASVRLRGGVTRRSLADEHARSSGYLGVQLSLGELR